MSAPITPAFLDLAMQAAIHAQHVWPDYAACEAALESAWGKSQLAREANNLFGQKQRVNPIYPTVMMPTREFIGGTWQTVQAGFVKYPSWAESFADRMATLRRLAVIYPQYAAALAATDGETFIRQVSQKWSTDPERAAKVLEIHSAHFPSTSIDTAAPGQ